MRVVVSSTGYVKRNNTVKRENKNWKSLVDSLAFSIKGILWAYAKQMRIVVSSVRYVKRNTMKKKNNRKKILFIF